MSAEEPEKSRLEAQEREAATREILRVISRSPGDYLPVFNAILDNTCLLCDAPLAALFMKQEDGFHLVAHKGASPDFVEFAQNHPVPLDPALTLGGRAAHERVPLQTSDRTLEPGNQSGSTNVGAAARLEGIHRYLVAPMVKNDESIGIIVVYRREARPFDDAQTELISTFAEQAVIAVDMVQAVEARADELDEARERQTAISEILRTISRSPDDCEPVFAAILDHATRLSDAPLAVLLMKQADGLHLIAHQGGRSEFVEYLTAHPLPLDPMSSLFARAVHEGVALQLADYAEDEISLAGHPNAIDVADIEGVRSLLAVPLVKNDESIGVLVVYRRGVRPFDDSLVALLSTFADQAVIALDNLLRVQMGEARADTLGESLAREAAMRDVLRVISRSPDDYQPVFEVILENACRLCDAHLGRVLIPDADKLRSVTERGSRPEYARFLDKHPFPVDGPATPSRALATGKPVLHADMTKAPTYLERQPNAVAAVEIEGVRSVLAVPMLKGEQSVGVIVVYRREVRPFDDSHVDLLTAFADQAVIAIENVRLFQAEEARKRELREALERQTATSEILSVINSSPTDYAPVFDAILGNACKLCDAPLGFLYLVENSELRMVAARGSRPAFLEFQKDNPTPMDPDRSIAARALLECAPVQREDLATESIYDDRPAFAEAVKTEGVRTFLAVPLHKNREPIGTIVLYRREVRLFGDAHVGLVSTFADQAVIAIENVRQFQALETRTEALTESLERQTATSEILRAISDSPTDYQPVFDTILKNACHLCEAPLGVLFLARDDGLHVVASRGGRREFLQSLKDNPSPLDPKISFAGRALSECVAMQKEDLADDDVYRDRRPHRVLAVETEGIRTFLAVPMHKHREPVGVIGLYRREVRSFEDKHVELVSTFADQAVIAIENVRLFQALETRTEELTESLEQQTATSEILRVISGSPTDYQPVFDAILENASRLCEAPLALLLLDRDGYFELVASNGAKSGYVDYLRDNPPPVDPDRIITARAMRDCTPLQCEDMADEELYQGSDLHRAMSVDQEGIRTFVAIPLHKDGVSLGAIVLYRREVRPFTNKHIELASTFADQAVIAIDNVRLFNELSESLERQTATSEILRTISRSPTDYQPVFDSILDSATRLCDAPLGTLFLKREDGFHIVANKGGRPEFLAFHRNNPIPLDPELTLTARAARDRVPLQSADRSKERDYPADQPNIAVAVSVEGVRSILVVPLVKNDESIGVITVYRREVRPFDESHVSLISTFADQAVIAIDNVRMFQALEARTQDLGQALERQTATSEILRTISRSPTDYEPVFDAILNNARKLCDAPLAMLMMRREDGFHVVAHKGARPEFIEFFESHPLPLDQTMTLSGQAAYERVPLQLADYAATEKYREGHPNVVAAVDIEGIRSLLSVPLVKNDESIGVLVVYRREVRSFDDGLVALVSTFADQAVIAIDNVRMFRALEARSEELSRSVSELRALGQVGQAVSSTLDLEAVLNTIINQAVALSGTDGGAISEFDELTGTLPLRAAPGLAEVLASNEPPRLGEGAMGRAAETRAPVQIPDVDAPGAYTERLRPILQKSGLKALLAVPLLREDRVLGALLVARKTPGEFPEETVKLLGTFAAQSAIAIQNARLFREIEEKGRELEAANRHKSEFLANMSHELRTPLNAVIGFSEVLGEEMFGELNEKQSEYVNDIHSSGRHLLSLINDILDLSKIEAGRMELDLSRFEIRPALDNALTLVGERAGRRNIALETDIEDALGKMTGDERKLKQILLNLLSNAIKFTPQGGKVTLAAQTANGALHIDVRDTGVGISADDQKVIFDEFRQVGTDYARKVEGTGLGLTLTRRFVELHGGEISVESQVGVGSVFHITLPVTPPAVSSESE